ncbi:hypothetical protein [Primorskyibacter sp. S87]|uniref:hypothetical protein n=1 Tax=Primorskyibacter sp. S87 TaxID=3415126 RepID=UPI003C7B50A8
MSDTEQSTSNAVRAAGWIFILLFLFLIAELFSFAAIRMVPQLRLRTYSSPAVSEVDYATYLDQRNPELGWPSKGWLASFTDQDGARLSPENDRLAAEPVCVSLFGDSFTFADEVDDVSAWGNVLAGKLGCRVANFGVGGFGTDQAVLRLERKLSDGVDIGRSVILAVFPDDLNRTVNGWRYLVGGDPLGFKPMFVATENGYELQPVFDGSYAEYQSMAADPTNLMSADQYLPGSPGFKRQTFVGFPYSLTLLRILRGEYAAIRSFGAPSSNFWNYPGYFDTPGGPSEEKIATNQYVIARFLNVCEQHVLNCAVMLIPDPEMVYQTREIGTHTLGWIMDGVPETTPTFDASEAFRDVDDICRSLTRPDECQGHFDAGGNERLAKFVAGQFGDSILKEVGLSPMK